MEAPANAARGGVECVEGAVVGAYEDEISPDRRRGIDVAAGCVGPPELAAGGSVRVDLRVGPADVDPAECHGRRRVEPAPTTEPVLGRRAPDAPAGASVEFVDVAVVGADVDGPARIGRRALHGAVGVKHPTAFAGPDVEGVNVPVPVADVDEPSDDEGRRLARSEVQAP